MLEDNLEQSILREERELDSFSPHGADADGMSNGKPISSSKPKADVSGGLVVCVLRLLNTGSLQQAELEQTRKKLADLEMKSARAIHDVSNILSFPPASFY